MLREKDKERGVLLLLQLLAIDAQQRARAHGGDREAHHLGGQRNRPVLRALCGVVLEQQQQVGVRVPGRRRRRARLVTECVRVRMRVAKCATRKIDRAELRDHGRQRRAQVPERTAAQASARASARAARAHKRDGVRSAQQACEQRGDERARR